MMPRQHADGIAADTIPFGAYVRIDPDGAEPALVHQAPDRAAANGVLLRDQFADAAAAGDPVIVITDTIGIMSIAGWVAVSQGVIVDA